MRDLTATDYITDPSYTKEFTLFGKDKKAENVQVTKTSSVFNNDLKVYKAEKQKWNLFPNKSKFLKTKVSNCGTSGCKKEQLTPQEVEKAMTDNLAGDAYPSNS